jgi:uncharacterized membrane protein YraQ (UPF0718 family)
LKRQQIPLVIMLVAGTVTSLTVYIKGLGLKTMLIALLATFVIFYFIGSLIKLFFDHIEKENLKDKKISDEGEVIEKEADSKESETDTKKDS